MNTLQTKKTSLLVSKYLLQLVAMALFYFLLLVTTMRVLNFIVLKHSTIIYGPDKSFNKTITILLIIYAVFSYLVNNFILDLFHKATLKPLIISLAVDMLIIPLQVWLMVVYNNLTFKNGIADINTVYNIYVITILFIIKNMIAVKILTAKIARKKV